MQKRRNALGYNVQASFISGFDGVVAPPFERAYLGGENDLRGFDIRTVSPIAYLPSVQSVALRNPDGSFVPANPAYPVQSSKRRLRRQLLECSDPLPATGDAGRRFRIEWKR